MKNSDLMITPDLEEIINKRNKTWKEFDKSKKHAVELDKLASQLQIKLIQATSGFAALTSGNTPPVELANALQKLEAEVSNVRKAQSDIEKCESEIKSQQNLIAGAVVVAVIIVIVIIIGIANS